MFRFIETIKYHNGELFHLNYHQQRLNRTFREFFPKYKPYNLVEKLQDVTLENHGLIKLRIVYDKKEFKIEALPYERKQIGTLSLQEIDFSYSFKFENRSDINDVLNEAQTDEVIFTKNGYLLDASYANLAMFDGDRWWTPSTFLLNGTTRQRLLKEKQIFEKDIHVHDLQSYEQVSFINALNELGERTVQLNN